MAGLLIGLADEIKGHDVKKILEKKKQESLHRNLSSDHAINGRIKGQMKRTPCKISISDDGTRALFQYHGNPQNHTLDNFDLAFYMQLATVVIDGVLLVMNIIGIYVDISKVPVHEISNEVAEHLQNLFEDSGKIEECVKEFIESWFGNSTLEDKAKALYNLYKDIHEIDENILKHIMKLLFKQMTFWEKVESLALTAAHFVVYFTSGGLALIGKIVLALHDAWEFFEDIENLKKLNELRAKTRSHARVNQHHTRGNRYEDAEDTDQYSSCVTL